MIAKNQPPKKVWTEADLEALLDNGYNHELVNGEHLLPGFRLPIANLFAD